MRREVPPLLADWRAILDRLKSDTQIDFQMVCEYTGMAFNKHMVSYYAKLPKLRRTYVAIGMAYRQSLQTINEWIMRFGNHKKLYAKDICEDIIWIYLINLNANSAPEDTTNYYQLYEECHEVAQATWEELWNELLQTARETAVVEIELAHVQGDEKFAGLKEFIVDHMDSFKTAYCKPRRFLRHYLDQFLKACAPYERQTGIRNLSSLRGWLDDSMVNYISGDTEVINVLDPVTHRRTIRIKQIPKRKKTHIALCLALGFDRSEIDEYLSLMGYSPLSEEIEEEKKLISMLEKIEVSDDVTGLFKEKYMKGKDDLHLTKEQEIEAINLILTKRQRLFDEYDQAGCVFPYMR